MEREGPTHHHDRFLASSQSQHAKSPAIVDQIKLCPNHGITCSPPILGSHVDLSPHPPLSGPSGSS